MTKTIGNPLTWLAGTTASAGRSASDATEALGSEITTPPEVRTLSHDDLRAALHKGLADFVALRSDVFFLIAIYPLIGITLALTVSLRQSAPALSTGGRVHPAGPSGRNRAL